MAKRKWGVRKERKSPGGRIVVRALEGQDPRPPIAPPDSGDALKRGEVISVDPERAPAVETEHRVEVSAGDKILYSQYGGTKIHVEGEDLLVLRERDVLAKIEETEPADEARAKIAELRRSVGQDIERLKHLSK